VVKQGLDEGGAPIDQDITTIGLLQRRDVFGHVAKDMAVVPLHLLQASGYDIFRHPVDGVGELGAGLARPVPANVSYVVLPNSKASTLASSSILYFPVSGELVFKLPTAMRMRGFIAAGRLDNTIEGDEFGNDNFSHDLFL
jgi:hypothetical protein